LRLGRILRGWVKRADKTLPPPFYPPASENARRSSLWALGPTTMQDDPAPHDRLWLQSMTPIEPGDELTIDYA
jgi:hypothetical protein